jgi:hypothetical protein
LRYCSNRCIVWFSIPAICPAQANRKFPVQLYVKIQIIFYWKEVSTHRDHFHLVRCPILYFLKDVIGCHYYTHYINFFTSQQSSISHKTRSFVTGLTYHAYWKDWHQLVDSNTRVHAMSFTMILKSKLVRWSSLLSLGVCSSAFGVYSYVI